MSAHTCEEDEHFAEDCRACVAAYAAQAAYYKAWYHPRLKPLAPHELVWRSREDIMGDTDRGET